MHSASVVFFTGHCAAYKKHNIFCEHITVFTAFVNVITKHLLVSVSTGSQVSKPYSTYINVEQRTIP